MRSRALFWGGLVVALIVVSSLLGGREQSGDPLDPDSTDPLGTRGLVLFLEELGVSVERDLPTDTATTVLVLSDQLDPGQREQLLSWVDDGGTVVVADPGSPIGPELGDPFVEPSGSLASGPCPVDGLGPGLRLEAGTFLLYPAGRSAPSPVEASCFGDADGSYLVVTPIGQGRRIALGGAAPLTNQNLDRADNAVLAGALLASSEGATVSLLFDPLLTPGSRTLGDLVPSGAKWGAWQLLVAFALYVGYRVVRFGRPIDEPQPVELPGSLLVRATAELQRRARSHQRASTTLRANLDRRLRRQLRAAPELPTAELIDHVGARADLDPRTIERALAGPPAEDGSQLTDVLDAVDQVATAVLDRNDHHDHHDHHDREEPRERQPAP